MTNFYKCRSCGKRWKFFKTLESLKAARFKGICAECIVKITDIEEFHDIKTARLGELKIDQ